MRTAALVLFIFTALHTWLKVVAQPTHGVPTVGEASAFMTEFEAQLLDLWIARERSDWRSSLPFWIVRRLGTADDNFNFNPMLILFRGLRYPFVYRYFFCLP